MKRPLCIALLALVPLLGNAQAAYEASVGVAVFDGGATSQETGNITPANSDRLLLCYVHSSDGTPNDVSQVKFGSTGGTGGTGLTQVGGFVNVGSFTRASVWRLIAPAASAGTVWAEWAASETQRVIVCGAFSNVDQTTPLGTLATTTGSASGTHSLASIGADTGDLVVDFISYLDLSTGAGNTPTPASGQTERVQVVTTGTAYDKAAMGTLAAASTSETRSWTVENNPTVDFIIAAVALKEPTGGGGVFVNPISGRGGAAAQPIF